MSYFATSSYKPQIRQEGFHTTTSPRPSPPPQYTNGPGNEYNSAYALPDAFRKYPQDGSGNSNMDFGDELASLIAVSPRPAQSPPADEYAHHSAHNIFDISAHTTHQQQQQQQHSHQQQQQQQGQQFPAHFSLPTHRPDALGNLGSQPSSLHAHHQPQHQGLHDFHQSQTTPHAQHAQPHAHTQHAQTHSHSHFNSTLPALNSSLRFDPNPPGPPPPSAEPMPPSSFNYTAHARHTPSPIGTSRSRSRSRAPSNGPSLRSEVGSIGGVGDIRGAVGPTRTARRERRTASVSSTSPPPISMPGRPSAIVIPGRHHSLTNVNNPNANGGIPVSPLSLHSLSSTTSGWFMPPSSAGAEYSLPTPESITNPFFHAAHHMQNGGGMGVSPSDVSSPLNLKASSSSLREKEPPSPGGKGAGGTKESKQALLANEKRRRRRESHNAVERRRRDNINEKISELATLIPECMLDPSDSAPITSPTDEHPAIPASLSASLALPSLPSLPPPTPTDAKAAKEGKEDEENGVVKANKGMILRKSVEYIRYLQQLVSAQAARNRELERALRTCGGSSASGHAHHLGGEGGAGELDFGGLVGMGEDDMGMMGVGEMGEMGEMGDGMMEGMHTPTSNESPRPTPPHQHQQQQQQHTPQPQQHPHHGQYHLQMGAYGGFGLPSMPENEEMLMGGGMGGDGRPGTMMSTSTHSGSDGDEHEHEEGGEEEERGRRGRDGRAGQGGVQKFEMEEGAGMEA